MEDQGRPSTRCPRRRVSAMTAASWLALDATRIRTAPGSAPASGSRSRWPRPGGSDAGDTWDGGRGNASPSEGDRPAAAGSRAATRREAASSTGPLRRQVRRAMTLAAWSSGVRNRSGKRPIACTSAPRNA